MGFMNQESTCVVVTLGAESFLRQRRFTKGERFEVHSLSWKFHQGVP